jgi:hypothetical protein
MKVQFPMDSLLKIDAMSGSLLVDDSLDRVYVNNILPIFLAL